MLSNTGVSHVETSKPVYFRLPEIGRRCPHFGLSRAGYYELESRGLIKLKRIKKPGASRGTTLVDFAAVAEYLAKLGA